MKVIRRLIGLLALVLISLSDRGDGEHHSILERAPSDWLADFQPPIDRDDSFSQIRSEAAYKSAYREASNEAETALRQGLAFLYGNGGMGFGMSDVDPETGLPVVINSACVITPENLGQTDGNNDRVRAWVKRGRRCPNSLLAWEEEISDLEAFFAARAKEGATIDLRGGGPVLISPDHRYQLRQVAAQVTRWAGEVPRQVNTIGLEVTARGRIHETLVDDFGDGLVALAWGPPDSHFAVVETRSKDELRCIILHLQPVDWLTPRQLRWKRYLKDHPGAR